MLVVLSKTHKRKTSQALLERLRSMDERVWSSVRYSTSPAPEDRTPFWRPPVGTLAELSETAHKFVVDNPVGTHESDERSLQQGEDLARMGD